MSDDTVVLHEDAELIDEERSNADMSSSCRPPANYMIRHMLTKKEFMSPSPLSLQNPKLHSIIAITQEYPWLSLCDLAHFSALIILAVISQC